MNNFSKLQLENYKPLRDVVFENIREAILEGRLEPGKRLMETQLADELGVSRTPVREAIRKLELEGLVIMLPRKGAYVAEMSKQDLLEVLEIRSGLESLAAYLAADRMDKDELEKLKSIQDELEVYADKSDVSGMLKKDVEFHECIFNSTDNLRLIALMSSLWEQVYRFRLIYMSDYTAIKSIVDEHREIIRALEARDDELSARLAKKHIDMAERYMLEKMVSR